MPDAAELALPLLLYVLFCDTMDIDVNDIYYSLRLFSTRHRRYLFSLHFGARS